MSETVAVTGATGFLGRQIVAALAVAASASAAGAPLVARRVARRGVAAEMVLGDRRTRPRSPASATAPTWWSTAPAW